MVAVQMNRKGQSREKNVRLSMTGWGMLQMRIKETLKNMRELIRSAQLFFSSVSYIQERLDNLRD
jgi:hypothetical protein